MGPGGAAPSGHVLAAWPERVEVLRVADLQPGQDLAAWLRGALAPPDDGCLCAVLLGYDAGRALERWPGTALEDPELPDAVVARYPAWLEAAGPAGPWRLCGRDERARARLEAWLAEAPPETPPTDAPGPLTSRMDRAAHRAAVLDVLDGIRAGDLYQANVARRLEARLPAASAPWLYRALRQQTPAAFGALWALADGLWLASASPECLLTWDAATRELHSHPIKGTRPRGVDPASDGHLADALLASPKDAAEHVMIVDLVRNDLGRVAVPGSVKVRVLAGLQTLPTVHHLVSDVQATARPDVDLVAALLALFPGGSITGAPKIAAMARIERVEGLRRGFYTGSFGLVWPDGRAAFNILIRTCVLARDRLLYQSGGGIVADSDPDVEWEETEHKARALERALDQLRGRPSPEPAPPRRPPASRPGPPSGRSRA
ncbi:MAG: anthranilate synthase component I family protein [Deltaproteobacteria bacterium]|nr:anthranilate synthase component I family protein [Deltaproteobacteria bacterium]MCB9788077.1 anthranilate synthase component I family protein [Deltaproteobacteria bacterium]